MIFLFGTFINSGYQAKRKINTVRQFVVDLIYISQRIFLFSFLIVFQFKINNHKD